jgi:serine/threonine protein kinase
MMPTLPSESPQAAPAEAPLPDKRIGDFELQRLLGTGSFGRVFLARQLTLGRLVALKVSQERGRGAPGREARTLARLEHANIVQVFSESFDSERGLRLLCMQYVPGTTLERVFVSLSRRERSEWSGRAILDIIDAANTDTVPLDPTALRDREHLAGCPYDEAVSWIGARLAEALAHAHALGVRHRDVKPANVLLNRYGRPLLADFNVAFTARTDSAMEATLGGTLAYMAPEHLDAFAGDGPVHAVDERADIYALGVVLFELLAGRPPFEQPMRGSTSEVVRKLSAHRRAEVPRFPPEMAVSAALAATVRRCLHSEPERRFQTAADLGRALDGCRELRRVEKALPAAGPLTRALQRWPIALGCLLALLPHVFGSVVNVSYNTLRIVGHLTAPQKSAFFGLVLGYNAIVYPACLVLLIVLVLRLRRRLMRQGYSDSREEAVTRRALLRLPLWVVLVSCIGWLPGGLLFPLGIDLLAEPVGLDVIAHFVVSFTISGLIALTYSFLVTQYLAIRVLYPTVWSDAQNLHATASTELRGQAMRLGLAQILAVLIPLAAAVMMVGVGPEDFGQGGYRTFRLLVTTLIALGMGGLGVAMMVSRLLNDTLAALTAGERNR